MDAQPERELRKNRLNKKLREKGLERKELGRETTENLRKRRINFKIFGAVDHEQEARRQRWQEWEALVIRLSLMRVSGFAFYRENLVNLQSVGYLTMSTIRYQKNITPEFIILPGKNEILTEQKTGKLSWFTEWIYLNQTYQLSNTREMIYIEFSILKNTWPVKGLRC